MTESTDRIAPLSNEATISTLTAAIEGTGANVSAGQDGLLNVGSAKNNELVIEHPTVSRYHCQLSAVGPRVRLRDLGSTNGTIVAGVRIADAIVEAGTLISVGAKQIRVGQIGSHTLSLHQAEVLGPLVGASVAMRRLMTLVSSAANGESPVLISGESGVGKELVAQALHDLGPRSKKPFVTVDCGSLSPELVASELFGHERGAFTGAARERKGAFEAADGGTLFLDEVGELTPALQAQMLGVLERRRLRRVGGERELSVDVRVVAATNRDLRREVSSVAFRLDLYYRIATVRIDVPPLRERREDIPILVGHFLSERQAPATVRQLFSEEFLRTLQTHRWSGNVRALRNLVDATVDLGRLTEVDDVLSLSVPLEAGHAGGAHDGWPGVEQLVRVPYTQARAWVLETFERLYVQRIINRANGNVAAAARESGLARTHLFDILRRIKRRGAAPDETTSK